MLPRNYLGDTAMSRVKFLALCREESQSFFLQEEVNLACLQIETRAWKRGSFGKGVFSEISAESGLFRDSRDSKECRERGQKNVYVFVCVYWFFCAQ